MDKIFEILSKLLPEDQTKELSEAIQEALEEAKKELEAEYEQKLETAYNDLSKELVDAEKVGENGYQEAWAIIADLRNRLETQKAEGEAAMEEGFEEAYQMLQAEKGKNEKLESELYEMYDNKLNEMKTELVDRITDFLEFKTKEIYEAAKKEVVNDPRTAESRVALDKVANVVADYVSDEDFANINGAKIEEASKKIEDLHGRVRILEAKNIRLSTENTKLNEQVRSAAELLSESANNEKKEREKKAKNVQGRGRTNNANEIIKETVDDNSSVVSDNTNDLGINETTLHQMQVLSGVKKDQ